MLVACLVFGLGCLQILRVCDVVYETEDKSIVCPAGWLLEWLERLLSLELSGGLAGWFDGLRGELLRPGL